MLSTCNILSNPITLILNILNVVRCLVQRNWWITRRLSVQLLTRDLIGMEEVYMFFKEFVVSVLEFNISLFCALSIFIFFQCFFPLALVIATVYSIVNAIHNQRWFFLVIRLNQYLIDLRISYILNLCGTRRRLLESFVNILLTRNYSKRRMPTHTRIYTFVYIPCHANQYMGLLVGRWLNIIIL